MGKYKHTTSTEYVPYEKSVTITEKRAVTDKSVELLNEFQKKAKENLIYSTQIERNHLRAVVMYYRDDLMENRVHFHIKFNLNGTDTLITDYVDRFDWRDELSKTYCGFGNREIFILVHKKLSDMIALELMRQSPDFINDIQTAH